ncbi:hypothetical protein HPB52_009645 [Rhipicephalus sanguineus]|uniref:Uncharacterized protein n=1 Tax=Rhipicephalus sanguineus TaxID=34632 RepID=A0A9D4T953_RHISA|nr:hypothetical protein HPB52_009645 [Rhipicephalus sanguineus]
MKSSTYRKTFAQPHERRRSGSNGSRLWPPSRGEEEAQNFAEAFRLYKQALFLYFVAAREIRVESSGYLQRTHEFIRFLEQDRRRVLDGQFESVAHEPGPGYSAAGVASLSFRRNLGPKELVAFFGLLEPSSGHWKRMTKIWKSECWRQVRFCMIVFDFCAFLGIVTPLASVPCKNIVAWQAKLLRCYGIKCGGLTQKISATGPQ